jgi:hypothetical protein
MILERIGSTCPATGETPAFCIEHRQVCKYDVGNRKAHGITCIDCKYIKEENIFKTPDFIKEFILKTGGKIEDTFP